MTPSTPAVPPALPPPGGLLVADAVHLPGGVHVPAPAHALLAGDLARRGVTPVVGPLLLGDERLATFHTTINRGRSALGIACRPGDIAASQAAREVLASWTEVAAHRLVLLASPRAFCAGVERAIGIVERALESTAGEVYVRKQIVHNTSVVADLAGRGAIFVEELEEVPDGATVVFSAHGVSPAIRADAAKRGLEVIDGTCPLVTKVHSEARRFASRGDTIVLIGHAGHEEVDGTMGEAPDSMVLVETADDVAALSVADPSRVSYLTQTTLATDETAEVVTALREKFPLLHEPPGDDICYASTNRQNSLRAVVTESDLVLVVGSANSSNSVRLVEVARRQGTEAQLIDRVGDIRPEWLRDVRTVGLTAGASAPPSLVDEVVAALGGLGTITTSEREVTKETIQFVLPPSLRAG